MVSAASAQCTLPAELPAATQFADGNPADCVLGAYVWPRHRFQSDARRPSLANLATALARHPPRAHGRWRCAQVAPWQVAPWTARVRAHARSNALRARPRALVCTRTSARAKTCRTRHRSAPVRTPPSLALRPALCARATKAVPLRDRYVRSLTPSRPHALSLQPAPPIPTVRPRASARPAPTARLTPAPAARSAKPRSAPASAPPDSRASSPRQRAPAKSAPPTPTSPPRARRRAPTAWRTPVRDTQHCAIFY